MRLLLFIILFQSSVLADLECDFKIYQHAESVNYKNESILKYERFFKLIEQKSIPDSVVRLYDVEPYLYEHLSTTVYAVQELINNQYIGQKFICTERVEAGKTILEVAVTYFHVDTNKVKNYHEEILNYIKSQPIKIFDSNGLAGEAGGTVLWDIRGGSLGAPMWRFSVDYKKKEDMKNPLYHYLIKSSKNPSPPPVAIKSDLDDIILYKLAE